MNILDVYIGRVVAVTTLLAVLGLVGVLTLFTFLEQLEDMVNSYGVAAVGRFVFYSIPRMFHETIPYSALIGAISGLGILAGRSELIVMRASGMSTWSIALSAMKPALVLVTLGLLVGEYVLPGAERVARIDRERAMSEGDEITPKFGFWFREGNSFMHFNEVGQGGVLGGINQFIFDDQEPLRLRRILYAKRAVYHDIGDGKNYWLLESVVETRLEEDHSQARTLPGYQWHSGLTPEFLSTEILVQPDKMSISELRAKIAFMKDEGLSSGKFELGLWAKIFQPLATIGLVLVAISFVFGPLREATTGMRVVSGLMIGVAFKFLLDLLSPASLVYGFPPMIAILVPIALCYLAGLALVRRAN